MKLCVSMLQLGLLIACLSVQAASDKPERVNDLAYGTVLFEYYQGNAFEALSLLSVAKQRGGIKGHGQHPDLVEGGLLLSYGMTAEAKSIFESLLEQNQLQQKLSREDQNLAWFYLGKVFYLEGKLSEALNSFSHIDNSSLKRDNAEKFYEMVYLKGQIAASGMAGTANNSPANWLSELPETNIFHFYLRYNEAVLSLKQTDSAAAISQLTSLVDSLSKYRLNGEWSDALARKFQMAGSELQELKALYNLSLLSMGELYLQEGNFQQAFETLQKVDKNSIFIDRVLFSYAIAASQLERYPLALSALTQLNEKNLFNPWQQQAPYALAYLYEKLNEPVLALEAYRAAVGKYEALATELLSQKAQMSESVLLDVLNIADTIGKENLLKDAYGRVQIKNTSFDFSSLLSSEQFQRQLSELHELYLLQNSLARWHKQLNSFEAMLATKQLSRSQKIESTQKSLINLDVDTWSSKEAEFQTNIADALAKEDAYFFMTDAQLSYYDRLLKAGESLRSLPDDHSKKSDYIKRFNRVKAYFEWWVQDTYSVNRWQAQKALKQLQQEMAIFRKQYDFLNQQEQLDEAHKRFVGRVQDGRTRLEYLQTELEKSLSQSSSSLLSQVNAAMDQQHDEIVRYLLASREALARVSDQLLTAGTLVYSEKIKQEDAEIQDQVTEETQ
ncbi:MAG: tetratricopeptide repeat protein [Oleiphilus sp.]